MAFWGFEHKYNNITYDMNGNPVGRLVRFDRKIDRFKWFSNYRGDGKPEYITHDEAKSILRKNATRIFQKKKIPEFFVPSDYADTFSMDQLWKWYADSSKW